MEMLYLQFLMVMEVQPSSYVGAEVSEYVSKVFTKLLTNEPSYKKKDYVKALDEAFRKMDELIDSP